MYPELLLQIITDNPITAGLISAAMAATLGFFKPIMRSAQAAAIRRIDRAYADTEGSHDERVQRTTDSLRAQTLVPLPRGFVEQRVRKRTPPSD